jgi:hypothetical protein
MQRITVTGSRGGLPPRSRAFIILQGGKIMNINVVSAVAAAAALVIFGAGCGSSAAQPAPSSSVPRPPVAEQPTAVAQAQSARDIAAKLGGTRYTAQKVDKPNLYGMIEAGNFWIGGTKYAVETFTSVDGRDARIKIGAAFGIVPKWETSTSIVYLSTRS